jgi:hypothetical protein
MHRKEIVLKLTSAVLSSPSSTLSPSTSLAGPWELLSAMLGGMAVEVFQLPNIDNLSRNQAPQQTLNISVDIDEAASMVAELREHNTIVQTSLPVPQTTEQSQSALAALVRIFCRVDNTNLGLSST